MTLVDKHTVKREISLGYGYEERERKRANRRERQGEKCLSWDMMVVVFFLLLLFFVTVGPTGTRPFLWPPQKRTLKLLAIHLRAWCVEHLMSHPCSFCLNKASCYFLNHNIQNSTAALARSHKQKACDAFSQPLSHHRSTSANGNLHPMFKTQQA